MRKLAEQRLIDANKIEFHGLNYRVCSDLSAMDVIDNQSTIDPETLPIVRQLREKLKCVTAERDAAIKDRDELLKRAEKEEYQKNKAISTINNILGCQKFCVLCGNIECKNSNTKDASCNPMWNGLEK